MSQTNIDLNSSSDWVLRVNKYATAPYYVDKGKTHYLSIKPFDLGITLNARFVAVAVSLKYLKPTWHHGGFLNQSYKLPFLTQTSQNQGLHQEHLLLINQARILEMPRLTGISYRLLYTPRTWYHPSKINRQVGGAKFLLHLFGFAADIRSNYHHPHKLYQLVDKFHSGGLGRYWSFIHVDLGINRRWITS